MSEKYPRTKHLPFSPGISKDDTVIKTVEPFINKHIIITEKIDGSNVCMENENCFARSHSSSPKHHSFDAFKAFHAGLKHSIPKHCQYFGEWVYAKHSIAYDTLPEYFLLFGIRQKRNSNTYWWSWHDIISTGMITVPVLFDGQVNSGSGLEQLVIELAGQGSVFGQEREGVVIRLAHEFDDERFDVSIAKYVRKNHIQTEDHWLYKPLEKNRLAK